MERGNKSSLLESKDNEIKSDDHVINMQLIDVDLEVKTDTNHNNESNMSNSNYNPTINKETNIHNKQTTDLQWQLPKINHQTMTTCDIHLIDYSSKDYQKYQSKTQCISCTLCILIVLLFYILAIALFNEALELIPQLIFWILCVCVAISNYYFRKRYQMQKQAKILKS